MEYMTLETLTMVHAGLDAMSSGISKVICFRNPHDIYQLHAGLEGLQASL